MDLLQGLLRSWGPVDAYSSERLVLALLVAFILGQLNAWVYKWTHRGVSYSRTFTHAIVLISLITAISMVVVSSSLIAAFGLLGALAIIRFRTIVRDARDTAYIFLTLVCGMAAGFGYYGIAIVGAAAANLVAIYLHVTGFGAWRSYESLLRFEIDPLALDSHKLEHLLNRFCGRHSIVSIDEPDFGPPDAPARCQCALKVRLRDPDDGPRLVQALKLELQTSAVHLLMEGENEDVI